MILGVIVIFNNMLGGCRTIGHAVIIAFQNRIQVWKKQKWASFEIYYPKKLPTNDIAWIDTPKFSYTSVVHLNHLKWSQYNIQLTSLRGHFRRPLLIASFSQSVYYQLWWAITDDIYTGCLKNVLIEQNHN